MATEKNISSRIIHKHDIEANWNKATNFIPKAGEIIVYDKDEIINYERFKIGDGVTIVNDLPFTTLSWNDLLDKPFDSQEISTLIVAEASYNNSSRLHIESTDPSNYFNEMGTYKITLDGTDVYLFEKTFVGRHPTNGLAIGDHSYSQIPLYIAHESTSIYRRVLFSDGQPHLVKIEYIESQVKTLDEKFIPNTIARISDIEENDEVVQIELKQQEHPALCREAIQEALNNGKIVVFKSYDGFTGEPYTTSNVRINDDNNVIITAPLSYGTLSCVLEENSVRGSIINYEDTRVKLEGWENELHSGSNVFYPSVKAMEEYVDIQITESGKQDRLSGTEGQIVGFDSEGNAVAQDNPQADWNQNDETAPDYVKNRPFYTGDIFETVILEEQSVDVDASNAMLEVTKTVSEHFTYIVNFNETEYECDVFNLGSALAMGNSSLTESDVHVNNMPFLLLFIETIAFLSTEAEGTYSISVTELSQDIVKIPSKFIDEINSNIVNGEGAFSLSMRGYGFDYSVASGEFSFAVGGSTASGNYSHSEGSRTEASGISSHSEGYQTAASGYASHAEGKDTVASGKYSHSEGEFTTVTNDKNISPKTSTVSVAGYASHAEGYGTVACGTISHAEGHGTKASASYSHAEGGSTVASGNYSHAEGCSTESSGAQSHVEGYGTVAASSTQHVQGQFNITDTTGTYSHIVGNGTSDTNRSNAHTLDWDGNAWFAGDVYVSSTSGKNKDAGSKKLVTIDEVNAAITAAIGQVIGGSY